MKPPNIQLLACFSSYLTVQFDDCRVQQWAPWSLGRSSPKGNRTMFSMTPWPMKSHWVQLGERSREPHPEKNSLRQRRRKIQSNLTNGGQQREGWPRRRFSLPLLWPVASARTRRRATPRRRRTRTRSGVTVTGLWDGGEIRNGQHRR